MRLSNFPDASLPSLRYARFFILYPIFASLTIFCNILLSPLNPEAEGDTQLLETVPGLIKGMRIRPMDIGERERCEQVERFIFELIRLAKCATAKAQREQ